MSDLTGKAHTDKLSVCLGPDRGCWFRNGICGLKVMLMSICHTLCVCAIELFWKSINAALNTTIHVLLEHCCSKYLLTCFYCYKSIIMPHARAGSRSTILWYIHVLLQEKWGWQGICGVGNRSWSPCPWRYKYSLQVCCYKNVCTMYQWRRATGSVPNIL